MNYNIIATDLDGTLLYDLTTVSLENYSAIAEYTARGGLVVPATGRSYSEIPRELRECPNIRYLISSGGGVITDRRTGEVTHWPIPCDRFTAMIAILKDYECFFTLHYDRKGYMNTAQDDEAVAATYHVPPYYFFHYHNTCLKTDFDTFLKEPLSPDMFGIFFRHEEEMTECIERFRALGGLTITSSAPYNIEVVAEGVSKGEAIRYLTKMLEKKISEVIGVGDSENDLSMLSAVGLPLAVSNAGEPLKKKAEKVICSHKEHIIRYILDNIIE